MALNFAKHGACYDFHILIFLLLLQVALISSTSAEPPSLHALSDTLQVLVPRRTFFEEFVDCSNGPTAVQGFCIDVFKDALSILIPKPSWTDVNYTCYDFKSSLTYNSMFDELQFNKSSPYYDAVVGDTTISADRMGKASFAQSYLDSGIVLLTPAVGVSQHFPGVFFAPFTPIAWFIVIVSIILTSLALWLIERNEDESIQRPLSRLEQFRTIFRFVSSVLVFFKQETPKTPISKFVMIAWTLYILLLGSSYTASLSSILTVNELSPEIRSIDELKSKNLSIGYQSKSIVKDYLVSRHGITNLVEMNNRDDYANVLHTRQVAAIVDEIPYISLFLADRPESTCKFWVSSKLTIEGLGFAFRDENISVAFSVAILNLTESGQLQKLQNGWNLNNFQCPSQIQSIQLDLNSSQGLFILLASAMSVCILLFLLKKMILPYFGRPHGRLRLNQQHDAIDTFWDPSRRGSLRRWWYSSVRHQATHQGFF